MKLQQPSLFVSCLTVALSSLVGCADLSEPESSDVSEAQLRNLDSREIVGTIAYGETVGPIQYTETPRYRALRFTGSSGETARITVTSNGIAALWLLASDFSTVTSARAAGLGRPVSIDWRLPSSGTFYIAFREADQEDASFTVTLDRAATQPSSELSIWDDAWATGPLATQEELLRHFSPGSSQVRFEDGVFAMRFRKCNVLTGCETWSNVDGVHFSANSWPYNVKKPLPRAPFDLVASDSGVSLECSPKSFFDVYWHNGSVSCKNGVARLTNVKSPYSSGYDLPSSLSSVSIPYTVYPTHAYGRSEIRKSYEQSGSYAEFQYVVHVKLSPSAPTPVFDR